MIAAIGRPSRRIEGNCRACREHRRDKRIAARPTPQRLAEAEQQDASRERRDKLHARREPILRRRKREEEDNAERQRSAAEPSKPAFGEPLFEAARTLKRARRGWRDLSDDESVRWRSRGGAFGRV